MRIADSGEADILQAEVMDRAIAARYAASGDAFNELVEHFASRDDKKFSEQALSLYKSLESYAEGIGFVRKTQIEAQRVSDNGVSDSEYERYAVHSFKMFSERQYLVCEYLAGLLAASDDKYIIAQSDTFRADAAFFASMAKSDDATLDDIRSLVAAFRFPKMRNVPSDNKTDEYLWIEHKRTLYKNALKNTAGTLLSGDDDSIRRDAGKTAALCGELYELLSGFEKELAKEKIDRGLLDYSDLERYTYKLFCGSDGKPTRTASEVGASFKQIYIDEYQDVNRVQDAIFRAIGNQNVFIVGDIKQSIYSFRGSAPELFADYREQYPYYDPNCAGKQFKVFLTDNFRCDESVIKFSNTVFASLFNNASGRVPYVKEDELVYKKRAEDEEHQKVTVAVIKDDGDKSYNSEARYVAREISRLIADGTPPSDIAVIMRKSKNLFEEYEREFSRLGIKYTTKAKRDLMSSPEILFVLACLKCIDDPDNDISLVALLKSPLFSFTPDELASITFEKQGSIYQAMKLREADNDEIGEKIRKFEGWLKGTRLYATYHASHEIINYLYSECMLEPLIKATSDIPSQAADDLYRLYELAVSFEASGFKGLHRFIEYSDDLKKKGLETGGSDDPSESADAIKLMTIHQSKGLEFRVCFLSDTGRKIDIKEDKSSMIVDPDLGVALKLRDESGYIRYNTLMHRTTLLRLTERRIEEEMRILYVALTRAKNKLYVTAKTGDVEKFGQTCRMIAHTKCQQTYIDNKSYIEWVLSSLEGIDYSDYCEIKTVESVSNSDITAEADADDPSGNKDERQGETETSACNEGRRTIDQELIKRYVGFEYKWKAESGLPSKISVSALYPGVLDEFEDKLRSNASATAMPAFMAGVSAPTGAERGTATHLFMQFCDFEKTESQGVDKQIDDLVELGFITEETAKLIYRDKIPAFFRSELYRDIKRSVRVIREYRFNVMIPAAQFTNDSLLADQLAGAQVLVQGVIDCFYENYDGNYVLIDYKTDRAYGDGAEQKIADEYRLQLGYYKYALEKLTGKKVEKAVIFAFDTGHEIVLDL